MINMRHIRKYNESTQEFTFIDIVNILQDIIDDTLRWLGESNGYYSERMSFVKSTTTIDSHDGLVQVLYSKPPIYRKK